MIFYLVFMLLSGFMTVWTAMGLRPGAKPQYWSRRSTGRNNVRMSRGSLMCFSLSSAGFCIGVAGIAFEIRVLAIAGWCMFFVAGFAGAFFMGGDVRRSEGGS